MHKILVFLQVAVIVVVSLLYSLPRFFEYEVNDDSPYGFYPTDLFLNDAYTYTYKTIFFILLVYIIPMAAVTILNLMLICNLRKAIDSAPQGSAGGGLGRSTTEKNNFKHKQKRSVSTVVATIAVLFVICHLLPMTSHLLYTLQQFDDFENIDCARRIVSQISNVSVNINSAANFIIYSLLSKAFRAKFKEIFCESCARDGGAAGNGASNGVALQTVTQTNATNLETSTTRF